MASRFNRLFIGDNAIIKIANVRNKSHRILGLPPEKARTLKQRIEEMRYLDPSIHFKVDIGLPLAKQSRAEISKTRIDLMKSKRNNRELEKLARTNQLTIPLEQVDVDWAKTVGPSQIKRVAEYFNVFQDLFGDAYFYPRIPLDIYFKSNDACFPVYRGNDVKPAEATGAPVVQFDAPPDSLWTLVLTNPDGHFTKENAEYVHWFVGNIRGGDMSTGEVIVDYMQPFPPRGTGYHRYIFVLYKQEAMIDYSSLKKQSPCLALEERTFSTYDFYSCRQEVITPAGLAFFQSDWDRSLTDFYHHVLQMREPVFEYDFDPFYYKAQKWFPLKEPFNLYLDRYRDQKQIAKEFLLKKLKRTHPFKELKPPLLFPNAVPIAANVPLWLKLEMKKERLGFGRVSDFNKEF